MKHSESCWPTREEILNPLKESPIKILRDQSSVIQYMYPNIIASITQNERNYKLWLAESDGFFKVPLLDITLNDTSDFPIIANGICNERHHAKLCSIKEFKSFLKLTFNSTLCIEILKLFVAKDEPINR